MAHESDDTEEGEDNDWIDLANALEQGGYERGAELAHAVVRFVEGIRDEFDVDYQEVGSARFNHSLGHALDGLAQGLATELLEVAAISPEDVNVAILKGSAAAAWLTPTTRMQTMRPLKRLRTRMAAAQPVPKNRPCTRAGMHCMNEGKSAICRSWTGSTTWRRNFTASSSRQ